MNRQNEPHQGMTNYSTWWIKAQLENTLKDYNAVNGLIPANEDVSAFADAIEMHVIDNSWRMQFPSHNDFSFKVINWWEVAETWLQDRK